MIYNGSTIYNEGAGGGGGGSSVDLTVTYDAVNEELHLDFSPQQQQDNNP